MSFALKVLLAKRWPRRRRVSGGRRQRVAVADNDAKAHAFREATGMAIYKWDVSDFSAQIGVMETTLQ